MNSRDLLPMGEISSRSGFAASAIRYYEAEGLITAHRSAGGQRRFMLPDPVVDKLVLVDELIRQAAS